LVHNLTLASSRDKAVEFTPLTRVASARITDKII
jgi:hypothetical protein